MRHQITTGMRPVHPGEVLLEDHFKPAGLSVRAASTALDVSYFKLLKICRGERKLTRDIADRLEHHRYGEAEGWLNLQTSFDVQVARLIYPGRAPTWKDVPPEILVRLHAADMIGREAAANVLEVKTVVIDDLLRTNHLIGVCDPDGHWHIPVWQFPSPFSSHLPSVLEALGHNSFAALLWIEAPLGGLNGISPRMAIERGQGGRVVQLARANGT